MGENAEGPEEQPEPESQSGGSGGEGSEGADGQRQAESADNPDDFLDAAQEAIDRALSGDSKKFLEANRQHGGQ